MMDLNQEREAEAMMLDLASQEKTDLVNLQMILATSSMNHEYTRKAYEKTRSYARRQELEVKMANLKNMYFAARNRLAINHPDRVEAIERELNFQKQTVLSEHGLH
jgi:sialic acid synthase SpsE